MTFDASDWVKWHEPYAQPGSHLERRLRWVQRRIGRALDQPRVTYQSVGA